MAMMKCGECGNHVSSKAPSCPSCGAPISVRKEKKQVGTFTGLIVIIVAIWFFASIIGNGGSPPSGSPRQAQQEASGQLRYAHKTINLRAAPTTDSKIIGKLERGDSTRIIASKGGWGQSDKGAWVYASLLEAEPIPVFEIVSFNWHKDSSFGVDGAVIWNVEVRNNSPVYVDSLKVEFASYDANGQLVTSDFAYVSGLSPGRTATAKSYATYYGPEEKARVRIAP